MNLKRQWWKEGVVYQIYPRSFQDTTGNGIGDLNGITKRLDYIKSLGVDIIWLCPIYDSPNDDNGYDIRDYKKIMAEFGTMADFNKLLAEMKSKGLKLVMDLVANHTSDEHLWFKESRKSRTNKYRDYYHWWPAEKGTPPKRWSYFDVDANAWKYDKQTDAYYLHYFSVKQPDLKWENPKVRAEIYDIIRFWFDKGVDGFRMDVIPFISKDTAYPELPEKYNGNFVSYYSNGPRLHEFLYEMNKEVLSKYDIMTVGEAPGITLDKALDFVDEDREELFGDEIGMTNARFNKIEDYKDINTLNRYQLLKQNNTSLADFIENEKNAARDNARTPMQWDASKHAGFTSLEPWIKVNANYKNGLNVASQEKDENSVLNYFKKMVRIRKNHLGLVYGDYHLLLKDNEQVYAYTRTLESKKYLVLLSFSEIETKITIDEVSFKNTSLLISNDIVIAQQKANTFLLKPYQASVYELT